jgi:anti-sigma B factor antagonist
MSSSPSEYFELDRIGSVTIVQVTAAVIRHPHQAEEFSRDLAALVERDGIRSIVMNFRDTHYLGSSAFAAVIGLARRLDAIGGKLALCEFSDDMMPGVNILGLTSIVPVFETEKEAVAAM